MGTYATKAKDVTRKWHLIDAEGQVLGRLACEAACLLRGKGNPLYVPYLDVGDHVVIVNAGRVRVTGRKLEQKKYFRHTGYPGGGRETLYRIRIQREPEDVVRDAVRGMLPKGPLGRQMLRKLKIYRGAEHPHESQQPAVYTLVSTKRA